MRAHRHALAAALVLASGLVLATGPASADNGSLQYTTSELPASSGASEPRATVTPDGIRYITTNVSNGDETVYKSTDGLSFSQTAGQPGNQTSPTTDVDVVTAHMSNGVNRIITSELDFGGINFRTAYSDDGGATWTDSSGTEYADTDRQWFAVGPSDPTTGEPRVYLLFHNLASGTAQHNMFVATSTDGGATFGPPVPITAPPSQAYLDLQCADSGGPSNIFTDSKGNVYAVFGTRSSPVGGCAAQPTEINVVAADRVWVVEASASGTTLPTGWTAHLAVNHSTDHHIVGMQLAPGAVDSAGNVYVAYPESPNAYPNYDGAAIEVVHAAAGDLDHWSAPSVVAPFGGAGNALPLIVAGDPGRVAVSWYQGQAASGGSPQWFPMAAVSTDALTTSPTWSTTQLSDVVVEKGTTSELMGACMQGQQATLNGLVCGRSTDVNGIAVDPAGKVLLTWPAQAGIKATDGTYASEQTGGPSLLATPPANLPETPWVPAGALAALAVVVVLWRRRVNAERTLPV
jgi:hypothetical protein